MNLSEDQMRQIAWEDAMYDAAMAIIEPQEPQGPCAGRARIFYSQNPTDQANALGWCQQCPMIFHCLRQALDERDPYGIWGGMLPRDRARVQQRRLKQRISNYRLISGRPVEYEDEEDAA